MRSIDVLAVNTAGVLCDLFPPGDHVFAAAPGDVAALDTAVRAALGGWTGMDALTGYVQERLPAFERQLLAEVVTVSDAEAARFAGALRTDLRPAEKIPTVVRTTLRRAMTRLEHLHHLDAVAEQTRQAARAVADPGWRPVVDPGVWIPDPAEVAATVDPAYSSVVDADISGLVLFAVLCTVGPAAWPIEAGPLPWRALGGPDPGSEEIEAGPGTVVIRPAIHDDVVDRLEYAVTPHGAFLRVALPK
ncbi:hypothetical protein [Actinoplanes subglobosus]|uniref:Uncharacterized protein n=1 Tax=Actinoplanes subglobosus TaxID=1547892 RepID=A0ABV8IQZ1_9ACTN